MDSNKNETGNEVVRIHHTFDGHRGSERIDGAMRNDFLRWSAEDTTNDRETYEPMCPLFMEGLPSDFFSNPQLAALASLLDEDCEHPIARAEDVKIETTTIGVGKVRSVKSRERRRQDGNPYTNKRDKEVSVAIGEAHLFLKMWKI
jgi:hypothetical protein